MQIQIPNTATFVANNNTETGHVWTIQFEGGERATVTATNNPNGTITYHILDIMAFWTTDLNEINGMLAKYAVEGNWEQEK
jgi:hypothetical protein